MKLTTISWTLTLALAAFPALASVKANTAQRLMGDMHADAIQVSGDASTAAHFNPADGTDWQAYLPYLNSLKTEINSMGVDLAHLKAMPEMESPAARQALRRVEPLLKQIAIQTDQATLFFNRHRDTLWQPEFANRLKSISSESHRIASLINDARQLSTIRAREATLRHDLAAKPRS